MRFLSRLAPHLLVLTLPATVLVSCSEYNLWEDPDEENPRTDTGDDIDPNAPAPDIRVEPAEISFGWRLVDCPAVPQTVTVTNVGDAELDVTDIRLEGAGAATFNLIGGPAKLAPTESFTFQVGFTAGAETEYTVEVQVDSNDPDTPIAVVDAKGSGAQTAINEQIFTQPDVGDVDVLWVVDNSGSMSDIVSHLGDRFESFLNSFDTLGIDYRIAVVSTDMDTDGHKGIFQGPTPVIQKGVGDPVSEFRQATDLGASGSGAEKGADAAYAALTSPLIDNENAGFLREDAVLAEAGVWDLSSLVGLPEALAHENVSNAELLGLLCEVGHPGEMFTSGAPADPIFFVIHATAERFLWTRILNSLEAPEKWPFDQTWGYDHAVSNVASDTKVVCDWSNVQSDLDMPVCSKGTCPGHREDDLLPFGNFLGNNETYTNYEFYEFMSPSNDDYPYVYDSLIHWPACDDAGEDITGASSDNSAGYDDEINMQDDDERR